MDKLNNAMKDIANLKNEDKVNIKGKFYTTVDTRVHAFRKYFGVDGCITTNIAFQDDTQVVVNATVSVYVDGEMRVIGTDSAEEFRGDGFINKTSAVENCCTSAIGRALAACGLSGGEYASAFEVENAIHNKAPATKKEKSNHKYQLLKNGNMIIGQQSEDSFLNSCRNFLDDPENAECKKTYNESKAYIVKAKTASTGETRDAFNKLLEVYGE